MHPTHQRPDPDQRATAMDSRATFRAASAASAASKAADWLLARLAATDAAAQSEGVAP